MDLDDGREDEKGEGSPGRWEAGRGAERRGRLPSGRIGAGPGGGGEAEAPEVLGGVSASDPGGSGPLPGIGRDRAAAAARGAVQLAPDELAQGPSPGEPRGTGTEEAGGEAAGAQ